MTLIILLLLLAIHVCGGSSPISMCHCHRAGFAKHPVVSLRELATHSPRNCKIPIDSKVIAAMSYTHLLSSCHDSGHLTSHHHPSHRDTCGWLIEFPEGFMPASCRVRQWLSVDQNWVTERDDERSTRAGSTWNGCDTTTHISGVVLDMVLVPWRGEDAMVRWHIDRELWDFEELHLNSILQACKTELLQNVSFPIARDGGFQKLKQNCSFFCATPLVSASKMTYI